MTAAEVAARAASMQERSETWLEPVGGDDDAVARRRATWLQRAAAGDEDAFAAMLAARGISDERAVLCDVRLVPGAEPAPWVRTLAELLDAEAEPADVAAANAATAGGRLSFGEAGWNVRPGLGAEAMAPLLGWLRKRVAPAGVLSDGIVAGFAHQVLVAARVSLEPAESFGQLVSRQPALGRALAVLARAYADDGVLLARRVAGDLDAIAALSDSAAAPSGCTVDAGDRHQGTSVTIVTLADGARVVYKPKDLRVSDALEAVLSTAGVDVVLPRRVVREGFGWEEFVDERLPADDAEWDELARDIGRWQAIAEVLGSTDLARPNVRIAAGRLVPIDHELMLSAAGGETGLLSQRVPGDGRDFGVLADPQLAPLRERTALLHAAQRETVELLGARRDGVARAIERLGATRLRTLWRASHVYAWLLLASLRPAALADGIERDLVLERLWAAHVRSAFPVAVVESEAAALRALEIPLFALDGDEHVAAAVARLHATP